MKIVYILLLGSMIWMSCEDNGTKTQYDPLKFATSFQDDTIDINQDGKSDFIIEYRGIQTEDIPSSSGWLTGYIYPLNDNQVLKSDTSGYLFLQEPDSIKQDGNSNSSWSGSTAPIITIGWHDRKYDKEWKVISNLPSGYFYFLGIKLKNIEPEQIGWLYIQTERKYGSINIETFYLTESDELKIVTPQFNHID